MDIEAGLLTVTDSQEDAAPDRRIGIQGALTYRGSADIHISRFCRFPRIRNNASEPLAL